MDPDTNTTDKKLIVVQQLNLLIVYMYIIIGTVICISLTGFANAVEKKLVECMNIFKKLLGTFQT